MTDLARSRYADLSRHQLATLVPELLLCGQMIDRSGMAWCIQAFGREEMLQIAIDEWAAASPIYTKRMQKALKYEGEDVVTIFKGLQLDIGAPPQYMDFRYTVHDRWHGEFHLDHCGALMDVEPMGPEYVRGMCHDIEDPTFDATAVATNPHAQVRPIHRPPRVSADQHPHCAWTVIIDEAYPPASATPGMAKVGQTKAATLELSAIDTSQEGHADYAGPLVSDVDFGAFSHSALVRIADEVCLQMHLLYQGFALAVRARTGAAGPATSSTGAAGSATSSAGAAAPSGSELAQSICTRQLIGIAGLAAERIHRALSLPSGIDGALRVLELHPLLNPAAYVCAETAADTVHVHPSPAHDDGAWISLCSPQEYRPLQAIVAAVDPHLDVEATGAAADWTARVIHRPRAAKDFPEVSVAKISGGATFQFEPRRSLPLTVV